MPQAGIVGATTRPWVPSLLQKGTDAFRGWQKLARRGLGQTFGACLWRQGDFQRDRCSLAGWTWLALQPLAAMREPVLEALTGIAPKADWPMPS